MLAVQSTILNRHVLTDYINNTLFSSHHHGNRFSFLITESHEGSMKLRFDIHVNKPTSDITLA